MSETQHDPVTQAVIDRLDENVGDYDAFRAMFKAKQEEGNLTTNEAKESLIVFGAFAWDLIKLTIAARTLGADQTAIRKHLASKIGREDNG